MMILEPEKWLTLETFLTKQASHMRSELAELESYFREQVWSKKIIDYRTKFLSPFSVNASQYFSDEPWYALQIIVEKPTNCYAILHDIGHNCDINCIQAGPIKDFINNPRFSGYSGLHFDIIFK
jgi:(p)ppGpp synthase/HD superfamily hydrolase